MTIKSYPTRFEIVEDEDMLGAVISFDEESASIECKSVFDVEAWRAFAAEVEKCLIMMELGE